MEKTQLRPVRVAAVQSGCSLLKLIVRVSAPQEPTALLVWGWVVVTRAASCRSMGVWSVRRPSGCGLSLVPVGHAARGLSAVPDGNSAKPPSCKIRGSWWSQGYTGAMLREASCWPLPPGCLKSAGSNSASLIFHRDLGGLFQAEGCERIGLKT